MRLMPVPVTQDELVAILEDMTDRVKEGDSFEGFLNYLMPITGDPKTDEKLMADNVYALVEARYRVGNTMGQGGMRIIGEWKEVPEEDFKEGINDAQFGPPL